MHQFKMHRLTGNELNIIYAIVYMCIDRPRKCSVQLINGLPRFRVYVGLFVCLRHISSSSSRCTGSRTTGSMFFRGNETRYGSGRISSCISFPMFVFFDGVIDCSFVRDDFDIYTVLYPPATSRLYIFPNDRAVTVCHLRYSRHFSSRKTAYCMGRAAMSTWHSVASQMASGALQ